MADFQIGDLVWAKMKSFSPWPAIIIEPMETLKPPKSKEVTYCVRFFGTNDHSWISASNIFPYEEYREQFGKKNITGVFKKAVQEIDDYAEKHPPRKRPSTGSSSTPKANGMPSPKKALQVNNKRLSSSKVKTPKITPVKRDRKDGQGGTSEKKRRVSGSSSASSSSNKQTARMSANSPAFSYHKKTLRMSTARYSPVGDNPSDKRNETSFFWTNPFGQRTAAPNTTRLLERPAVQPAETPSVDIDDVSDILLEKKVEPTSDVIGFLGLGLMGQGIVKNLIHSHHKVVIWHQNPEEEEECREFVTHGASRAQTPEDVVKAAQITFSCLSDPDVAKKIVFSNCGVLKAMGRDKGYVEMTSIDPDNSRDIADAITQRGGRYLEAPILGSRKTANDGTLNILAAGDRSLFEECRSCFHAIGERIFYLGNVGKASLMNLLISMFMGVGCAALGEAMALALRADIAQKDFLEILNYGALKCPAIAENGKAILENMFHLPNTPLDQIQKNMRMALNVSDQYNQSLPTVSAANETFKHAKNLGYAFHDISAVYMGARF